MMQVLDTELAEVKIIKPQVFADERGFFLESFQAQRYLEAGFKLPFVQDNMSRSSYGVLRGLHYQLEHPQGKLVTVMRGSVFDVAVDIRRGSPTFAKWTGVILNNENHQQFYIPPGFAHGFCVLSETADFHYKCTDYYDPQDEYGIIWDDQQIAIDWPLSTAPVLSAKDQQCQKLVDIAEHLLPKYKG